MSGLSRRQFLAAGLGAAGTLATGIGLGGHVLPLVAREDLIPGRAPGIVLDPDAWTTTGDRLVGTCIQPAGQVADRFELRAREGR